MSIFNLSQRFFGRLVNLKFHNANIRIRFHNHIYATQSSMQFTIIGVR